MKITKHLKWAKKGVISIALMSSLGVLLFALMIAGFRRSIGSQNVSKKVNLQVDYGQKEDAFARAVVGHLPMAMQKLMQGSSTTLSTYDGGRFMDVFQYAAESANASTRSSSFNDNDQFVSLVGLGNSAINGNVGDRDYGNSFYSSGVVTALGTAGYSTTCSTYLPSDVNTQATVYKAKLPPANAFTSGTSGTGAQNRFNNYPILSPEIRMTTAWASNANDYPQFNLIDYPDISFGYGKVGEKFIAKPNWWAFEVDFQKADQANTGSASNLREYCLSVYEVPSQLAISSGMSGKTRFGQFASGSDWGSNVSVAGRVYADKAAVKGGAFSDGMASRGGVDLENGATAGNVGAADLADRSYKEKYEANNPNSYIPVSSAADSGRVAFIPVNIGLNFYSLTNEAMASTPEADGKNVLEALKWEYYSRGAMQCAMRLWVEEVDVDGEPIKLGFSYLLNNAQPKYYKKADRSNTVYIATVPAAGEIEWKASDPDFPFGLEQVAGDGVDETGAIKYTVQAVTIRMDRLDEFLANSVTNAASTEYNNSLAFCMGTSGAILKYPASPAVDYSRDVEICAMLTNAGDLTAFKDSGFSLVTSQRLYIDSDVNTTPISGTTYPAISIFAPEKRYGKDGARVDVELEDASIAAGVGDAKDTSTEKSLKALEAKGATGSGVNKVTANLKALTHPDQLPPINYMNWLIVLKTLEE